MRSSLSCDSCRRAKVKCINTSRAPCERCVRLQIGGCQLKRPRLKAHRNHVGQSQLPSHANTSPNLDLSAPGGAIGSPSEEMPLRNDSFDALDMHLNTLPIDIVLKALYIFTIHFPELRMVHPAAVRQSLAVDSHRAPQSKALLAAILALVKTHDHLLESLWMRSLLSSNDYTSYAHTQLLSFVFEERPNIEVVQALLILASYEWGVRDFHKAWMHCGCAIRIMQSLHSSRVSAVPLDNNCVHETNELSEVVEAATYWTCMILDCTITSGTPHTRMLPLRDLRQKVPRPPTSTEFALVTKSNRTLPDEAVQVSSSSPLQGYNEASEILASGFEIYALVMDFIQNDGRKAPGMCAASSCPWMPGSHWSKLSQHVERWRESQDSMMHYPDNKLVSHMTLGLGARTFVYINLLYYQCIVMLHREYFPFLPTVNSVPQGPTDPPLLEAEAPAGWWQKSAQRLFEAAAHIACLLKEASEWGCCLVSLVPGFCGFTACYMNLYALYFPNMAAGYSPRAEELTQWGLKYLKDFCRTWVLGEGWIKTIQNASLLFGQATSDTDTYCRRSRLDFEILHLSAHEFRTLDRSEQHMQQIIGAERTMPVPATPPMQSSQQHGFSIDESTVDTHPLEPDTPAFNGDAGGWPGWWSLFADPEAGSAMTCDDLA